MEISTWKHHEVSHFYGLPRTHQSVITESAMKQWNHWNFEPNDLKLRPIVGGPKCPIRKLGQLIDILLKPSL